MCGIAEAKRKHEPVATRIDAATSYRETKINGSAMVTRSLGDTPVSANIDASCGRYTLPIDKNTVWRLPLRQVLSQTDEQVFT